MIIVKKYENTSQNDMLVYKGSLQLIFIVFMLSVRFIMYLKYIKKLKCNKLCQFKYELKNKFNTIVQSLTLTKNALFFYEM